MATYEITAKLNLEKLIAESREVSQAFNELADNLERIEKKYTETQEEKDKEIRNERETHFIQYRNGKSNS